MPGAAGHRTAGAREARPFQTAAPAVGPASLERQGRRGPLGPTALGPTGCSRRREAVSCPPAEQTSRHRTESVATECYSGTYSMQSDQVPIPILFYNWTYDGRS